MSAFVERGSKTLVYLFLAFGCLVCLTPFYWMFRSSLMTLDQIFVMPPIWFPSPIQLSNYHDALTMFPFHTYFLNTLTIVSLSVLGTVLTSSLCAYSFARLNWPGRDKMFALILTSMMLPGAATLIPTFLGWRTVGAINTFIPLILPSWFGGGAFNIFLLRQFFKTIPKELDEAALIDGAGLFRIYTSILLPLIKPALIVVALFAFLHHWNDFLSPIIYLNSEKNYTLAIGLQQFKGQFNAQWNYMMAASTVVILPTVLVFLIGQKYFIEGITLTGLKG
ncbi:carbohydrate ABC transporter permease [Paenibacillus abyssi]|uniref:Sugar ABC transporter permease n=1 Tax=Paenibacillus abyssi TaxID=1340531 RepID=A0A917G4E5_9BACL|nr:carbohydrate ABC transporter permease [Paenibacillus abyssi]GGG22658.1 sugar ABC transporter permease [Paenibacillus abyssi]